MRAETQNESIINGVLCGGLFGFDFPYFPPFLVITLAHSRDFMSTLETGEVYDMWWF